MQGWRARARQRVRRRATPFRAPDLLMLLANGVPKLLVRCLYILIFMHGGMDDDATMCHLVEFFAGQMEITSSFQRCGYVGIPFELDVHPLWMNINTDQGYPVT